MAIFKSSQLGVAALLALGLHAAPAQATTVRSFIASTGSDANTASNCPRATPCRTLAQAVTVTQAGGEIVALDAAGYGPITITQALSIVGVDGAFIAVPSGGTAITINAGVNDAVNIRGLIIEGVGVGANGITFNTGKSLTVTNSVIRGMTGDGILFAPNASSALQVSNTVAANNGNTGIRVVPVGSGTAVTASLSRVELYNNSSSGFAIAGNGSTGTITAVVADSVSANNSTGLSTISTSANSRLMVIRSVVANNVQGLLASGAAATLRVGQSTLTGNNTSWLVITSAILRSYADNNIDGNNDADPTPTAIGKK